MQYSCPSSTPYLTRKYCIPYRDNLTRNAGQTKPCSPQVPNLALRILRGEGPELKENKLALALVSQAVLGAHILNSGHKERLLSDKRKNYAETPDKALGKVFGVRAVQGHRRSVFQVYAFAQVMNGKHKAYSINASADGREDPFRCGLGSIDRWWTRLPTIFSLTKLLSRGGAADLCCEDGL